MPTHAEKRLLPYAPEQVYEVVAAVDRYPEFLPWCKAARITRRDGNTFEAELVIAFKMFRERFTSKVQLTPESGVDVQYVDGPFRYLNNHWRFHPAPGGSEVDFFVDFEFRSRLLQAVIGTVFEQAVRLMVRSFERRAMHLYGRNTAPTAATPPAPAAPTA